MALDVPEALELSQHVVGRLLGEAGGHGDLAGSTPIDAGRPEERDHRRGHVRMSGRVDARLGVMSGDSWTSLGAGDHMNVPRGTVHSFRNDGPDDVRVITGFEPQGFERFFLEYGVDVDEPGAFETSIGEATIARVIEGCAQFGMILAPM
jgi:hypothetical protein